MTGHRPTHVAKSYESDLVSFEWFGHDAILATLMKIVITGGGGFLGSQLARKLLDEGVLTAPCGSEEAIDKIVSRET